MLSHLQEKSDSLKRKFEVDNIKTRLRRKFEVDNIKTRLLQRW